MNYIVLRQTSNFIIRDLRNLKDAEYDVNHYLNVNKNTQTEENRQSVQITIQPSK